MRIRHALLSSAVSITLSIGLAPPAVAQSFFQKLFGIGGGQSAGPVMTRPQARPIPAYRFQYRSERRYQSRPDDAYEDEMIGPPDSGGPYRTMCVRACDGFYFPLRHNAWRRNFGPDAKSCRSACGEEARLFYYSLRGGSVDTMVDLAGRSYKELPHAFGYRKALVSGCACKPVPWSYEEAARHRQYDDSDAEISAELIAKADAAKRDAAEREAMRVATAAEHVLRPIGQSPDNRELPPGEVSSDIAIKGQDEGSQIAVQACSERGEAGAHVVCPAPQSEKVAATSGEQTREPEILPEPKVTFENPGQNWGARAVEYRSAERIERKRAKARFLKTRYIPTSVAAKQGGGFSLFATSKSKYTWPGDPR